MFIDVCDVFMDMLWNIFQGLLWRIRKHYLDIAFRYIKDVITVDLN